MKYVFLVLLFLAFSPLALAQAPKSKAGALPAKKSSAKPKQSVAVAKPKAKPGPPLSEKEQFAKASGYELAADRVSALEKFLADFPQSEDRAGAVDLLASSRVLIAEEKLLSGDANGAVALLKRVVAEAPQPVPNELFESISRIPATLFFQGQRLQAIELANAIESKVEGDAGQLVGIANFYLATENGSEAMRVAAKAVAKDPSSAVVHRTLALAHRINFDLDLSADEYAKSLELEPESVASKRGLAEMKRALGRSAEAVTLYRELITKNENDLPSRTGLVLALFDAGDRTEAEAELARSLEKTPGNMILLAGAAYWYASKGLGDKSVELAEKAVAKEPRYIWSHIALARGLLAEGKPVEAEQALIKARAFGNFPTLEYEIASARVAAGFFRDAVDDLQKQFTVTSSGSVKTNLGGRVVREEKGLAELVAFERKASIFSPAADNAENAEILKALLTLDQKLQPSEPNESEVTAAVDAFTKGSDKMRLHRQIYAAARLLQKRVAIDKVIDLSKVAAISSDSALDVANPRAAVMASELYEARSAAFRKNEFLLVPDVPNQTLSAILRGRIEEIAGWAFFQQNNFPAAIIRLRRAKSVLPDKSAWWRSSLWRLGAALAANGNDAEALTAYIDSYKTDKPDLAKYSVVEALYKKINGNTDGLADKLGAERVAASSSIPTGEPTVAPSQNSIVPAAAAPFGASTLAPAETLKPNVVEPKEQTVPKIEIPRAYPPVETKVDSVPKIETPRATTTPVEEKQETKVEPELKPEATPSKEAVQEPKLESEPKPQKTDQPLVENPEPKVEPAKTEIKETAVEEKQDPKVEPSQKTDPVQKVDPPAKEKPETKIDPTANTEPPQKIEPAVKETQDPKVEPTTTDPEKPKPGDPETKTSKVVATKRSPPGTTKSAIQKTTPPKTALATGPDAKLLFEPIIISIPNSKPPPRTSAEASGSERRRAIEDQEVRAGVPPCNISVSQENISLINGGGTVGLLVTIEAPGDVKSLKGISSSPKDIEVAPEPEISGVPDKRFFVLKSTSSSLGDYQVSFTAPCGKKDVLITVR